MKKRILFISEHASPLATVGGTDAGGQNIYVDKLAKELVKLGYEIDIFTRWDNTQVPQIIHYQQGIRVIHIKAGPIAHLPKEKLLPFMNTFTKNALRFIKKESLHYKLVHAHFFMSALVAARLKEKLGIPFVVTFHALGKVRRLHQGKQDTFSDGRFAIEEMVIKEADHIIAECPQDREDLIYHYNADQNKISIIPCGFDPHEFYPMNKQLARLQLKINQEAFVILQLGRIVPRKGVDTVIKAVGHLLRKREIPLKLIIVGGDSKKPDPVITPEIGRLQNLAKKEGITIHTTFTGRKDRNELLTYYNAADIFVSTPWYEPFGITPLESMACGIPVIGSEVGGIQFSVTNGKTGFLIPPKNHKALAEKITLLYENQKLREQMSNAAIKRVNTFFTWSTVASSVSSLYEKILFSSFTHTQEHQDTIDIIENNFDNLSTVIENTKKTLRIPIYHAASILVKSIRSEGKILICGNGGSACDAQHFAVELVGHFMLDKRTALPALALNTDSSILTAVPNDFAFTDVFARQVEALGKPGDILFGISTSGNSKNILKAFKQAKKKNMICIGLLGKNGGALKELCDIALVVPSNNTQTIQEIHTNIIHTLCEIIEKQLFSSKTTPKKAQVASPPHPKKALYQLNLQEEEEEEE